MKKKGKGTHFLGPRQASELPNLPLCLGQKQPLNRGNIVPKKINKLISVFINLTYKMVPTLEGA